MINVIIQAVTKGYTIEKTVHLVDFVSRAMTATVAKHGTYNNTNTKKAYAETGVKNAINEVLNSFSVTA